MEEHALAVSLRNSRERLRALLLPDPVSGRIEPDAFPRSAVMRFLFDARARRVAMTMLPMVLMLFGRRRRTGGSGLWAGITRSIGMLAGMGRR